MVSTRLIEPTRLFGTSEYLIFNYKLDLYISVEQELGEFRGNLEKWTILRSEIDIEEICPSNYSGLFIKCTSKIITKKCDPLRQTFENVKNLEIHGLVVWIWQIDRHTKALFGFDVTVVFVILQSWLMYEFFRKHRKPNEKWMKMWCIINFFNAVVSF